MKRFGIINGTILLAVFCSLGFVNAQEKAKEEREKELQEAINEQKKEMIEQQKAVSEAQKEVQEAFSIQREAMDKAMENLRDMKGAMDDPEIQKIIREYRDVNRTRSFSDPFVFVPGPGEFYHHSVNDNSVRTTWDFSKSIRESSFARDYTFDVDPTAKSVLMSVSGDCKQGEIRIRIIMPGGKTFSEIVIDEFGNLNWRKSLTITEAENQDKTGEWNFDIKAKDATGYFKIFFQTS